MAHRSDVMQMRRSSPAGAAERTPTRVPVLPTQRTIDRVVVPTPPPVDRWDDYRNAGPDVYWAPSNGSAA